jgi:hypothetical protein
MKIFHIPIMDETYDYLDEKSPKIKTRGRFELVPNLSFPK